MLHSLTGNRSHRRGPAALPKRAKRSSSAVRGSRKRGLKRLHLDRPEEEDELSDISSNTLASTKRLIHAAVRLWELRRGFHGPAH